MKKKMNKTLRKFSKNAKALSPVVASIILIAVTVAVSIAVAAWMGGMTVGFMGTSSVTVTNIDFATGATDDSITDDPDINYMNVTLKNTGTKTITVAAVKINNQLVTPANQDFPTLLLPDTPTGWAIVGGNSLIAGNSTTLTIIGPLAAWLDGNTYKIDMYDGTNQVIGSAQQNAPGA